MEKHLVFVIFIWELALAGCTPNIQKHTGYNNYGQIAFGNGTFVLTGLIRGGPQDSRSIIFVSKDGKRWTRLIREENLQNVIFIDESFYITTLSDVSLKSSDGLSWQEVKKEPFHKYSVIRGKDVFLCLETRPSGAKESCKSRLYSSKDLQTWKSTVNRVDFRDVAFGRGRYVGIANSYYRQGQSFRLAPKVYSTSDIHGKWALNYGGPVSNQLYALTYGSGMFIAVGYKYEYDDSDVEMIVSLDGINWRKVDSGIKISLYDIAFGNDLFIAVGRYGVFSSKDNGKSWKRISF